MQVIATAGHVDHGKSTLVRALTGMEPDRWAEERRRGLTIDLGFAWTDLPDGETVAFVDVPGHERFIANMLAGVGAVPAVMFVVAADEGWKPQSTEHLSALSALGVAHSIVVVTRSDLADPGPAREVALERFDEFDLAPPAVAVSSRTGEGLDELREALGRLMAAVGPPDVDADVRLWIDRVFSIRGAGTVVTGTLPAGSIDVDDELIVASSGERVRVRTLESLGARHDRVEAVARVGINLRNVARDELHRGDALVTPGAWFATSALDVRTNVAIDVRSVLCHVGSAAVEARVRRLGEDAVRLQLASPVPLRVGDRLVLRDPGSRRIVGATALDVLPPPLAGRRAAERRGEELAAYEGRSDATSEIRRRGVVHAGTLRMIGARPSSDGWFIDPGHADELRARLAEAVVRYGSERPLEVGMPLETAQRICDLPTPELVERIAREPLVLRDGRVHLAGDDAVPDDLAGPLEAVTRALVSAPFAPLEVADLEAMGLDPARVGALARRGKLLAIGSGVVLLPGADQAAAARLAQLPQPFTASDARRCLETNRRVVIPLLEYLDRAGFTRRVDSEGRRVAT